METAVAIIILCIAVYLLYRNIRKKRTCKAGCDGECANCKYNRNMKNNGGCCS